jgi:hypothetical protein
MLKPFESCRKVIEGIFSNETFGGNQWNANDKCMEMKFLMFKHYFENPMVLKPKMFNSTGSQDAATQPKTQIYLIFRNITLDNRSDDRNLAF